MDKEYKQQELFSKKGKVKKIGARFEIELEDGTILEINEEDAKKIRDELNKYFTYPHWYWTYPQYPQQPYISTPFKQDPPYKVGDFPPYDSTTSGTATYSWNDSDGNIHSKQVEYLASSGNHAYATEARDFPCESN